jgi:hypothetical protein
VFVSHFSNSKRWVQLYCLGCVDVFIVPVCAVQVYAVSHSDAEMETDAAHLDLK